MVEETINTRIIKLFFVKALQELGQCYTPSIPCCIPFLQED